MLQCCRGLIGIGLIRIVFLIALVGFITFGTFMMTSKAPDSNYVVGIVLLIVFMIHARREDETFLRINFNNYRLFYFAEYLILTSTLFLFLIFHLQWIPLIVLFSVLYLIIYFDFKPKKRSRTTMFQQLIPADSFEWKSGVRQSLVVILFFWIVGLSTSFFIGSVPIAVFVLGLIPFSFYERGEPYQMILAYEMGSNQFLFHKIKIQISLFSMLVIPLILAFLIFHSESWYIPMIEYIIFVSLYIYLILTKYAFYEPNGKSTAAQVFGAIGAFSGIFPLFLPLIWLLSIRFYFKSKENLNFLLNDYH